MFVIQDLLVDKSFLALDRQLNAFNIFDVLNLREYEIRHTRFLAHMLDPCGTHGLGSAFLRNFLLQVSAQLASGQRGGPLDHIHKLDLDLARVTAEISLATGMHDAEAAADGPAPASGKPAASSGRLDILLQIPRRGGADIAIAIENKINAKESNGQLKRYRDWVGKRFDDAVLLYLTVADEEVDAAWNNVTYSNVVYPALDLTSESCSPLGQGPALMMAHYMAVLRDKVEAEAAYADADSIAQALHKNYPEAKQEIDCLRKLWEGPIDGRQLDSSWGLYNRHKAAFEFLLRYDTDELSTTLRWFTTAWPQQVAAMAPDAPRIVVDDSNRSYLRFLVVPAGSALEQLSHASAQKARPNGKLPWTSRQHAVLFELRSYPVRPAQDAAAETAPEFRWNLFLVVGPVQGMDRTGFITRLRGLLRDAFPGKLSGQDSGIVPEVSQRKITQTFSSLLKWKLPAGNSAELEQHLGSARFLASLERVARIVEAAWAAEPEGRTPGA